GELFNLRSLTARETLADKVESFDNGTDDFLTKPFELEELCVRIRACVRRSAGRAHAMLVHKNIVLNPASRCVTLDGKSVDLPRREFALLHKLLENVGHVVSRDHLAQSIYGWEKDVSSNALEVHIHSIRKKLHADFILTVRGIGYTIEREDISSV
ncbi:MAG: winged helix-turn-helix domain-containing protein, partial [Gammaproteobacteria bacterium]